MAQSEGRDADGKRWLEDCKKSALNNRYFMMKAIADSRLFWKHQNGGLTLLSLEEWRNIDALLVAFPRHERKTRAPVRSDLIVRFEQPTASPFFPGIRPCRKEEGRPCHHNGRKRRTGLPPPARSRPGRRFFRAAVVPLICATPARVGHEFGRRGDRPGALPT